MSGRPEALHVERYGETSAAGGDRLVLVHGFTQTGRSWRSVAAALAAGHDVVTVDLPGHGGSGAVHADLPRGGRLLGEAGGEATYIGYSLGARVVLHLALANPSLVTRMVLLGGTAGIDDPGERADRRANDERLAADLARDGLDAFLDRWLANPLFAALPAAAADLDDRRRNTVEGLAASLRLDGTGMQDPSWEHLRRLEMPVLVLAGEHDAKFSALAQRMAEAIGSNATVALVPGAGHAAHLEQPEAFLAIVEPWLSRSAPARS
jgi:2-succinyl-6-hydroxy-2,4-cyclohexadiene-1-carboxylate synthase